MKNIPKIIENNPFQNNFCYVVPVQFPALSVVSDNAPISCKNDKNAKIIPKLEQSNHVHS